MIPLFTKTRFGDISISNRVVMAPLTRDRAGPAQVPTAMMVTYYTQRASAGLIITEASQISPEGQGYLDTPGIYSPAQVAGWRVITDAVHAAGGKIVIQLWHVGRYSHVSLQPGGKAPESSTAVPAVGQTFTAAGFEDVSAPRALREDEMPRIVASYRHAARCAMDAGFDGVEVHAAHGYLIEQFLRDSINDRTDSYGGSIPNRARLLLDVMQVVTDEIGAGRTALRLSPVAPVNDSKQDSDAQALYNYVVEQLAPLKLAYLHVVEGATGGARDIAPFDYAALRSRFKHGNEHGAWMVNNGYTSKMAFDVVASGEADLVAFGKPFISNPDLVQRLRDGAELALPNPATMYGGGAEGYIDYPTLDVEMA